MDKYLRPFGLWLLLLQATVIPAVALVFLGSSDPNHNTTAPTGTLTDSGWQWTGPWGGFQGVAIGPHHFLSARHIGGAVGDPFVLNGTTYVTITFTDDAASDLRIWEIGGTFPNWAPLYRHSDEVGRNLIVFGRGLIRGGEIRVTGGQYAGLKGWFWAAADGRLRWGLNQVTGMVDGGSYWGELLSATFDATGGTDEAHLATGDSGGPVFIDDGSGWKLAGIAATVDAYFNTTNTGNGFTAALFDARGLYYSATPPSNWALIGGPVAVPTSFYATRVSVRTNWIDSVVSPLAAGDDVPAVGPLALAVVAFVFVGSGAWMLRHVSDSPLT